VTAIGITRIKDEADIIASTVGHMLTQVDHVIVEDNGSTDDTLDILATLDVEVLRDPTVGYYQSAAMSRLAAEAASAGADVVIPFDADEIWYSPFGRIADVLAEHPQTVVFRAPLFDHFVTALDPDGDDPVVSMGWRAREAAPLRKVACRPLASVTILQGNHGVEYRAPALDDLLVVRHFALRSVEQMIRKARNGGAAYAATDLPEHVGEHWRGWNRLTDAQLHDVFSTYYHWNDPVRYGLIYDPAPCLSRS
jgi:glycosyltransferase involved in cell wall biosynthesis